jgi:hypothetical protein
MDEDASQLILLSITLTFTTKRIKRGNLHDFCEGDWGFSLCHQGFLIFHTLTSPFLTEFYLINVLFIGNFPFVGW